MSIVHCAEVEPHVLAALHMLSGCTSSHAYLPFFCACAVAQFSRTTQDNSSNGLQMLNVLSSSHSQIRMPVLAFGGCDFGRR